MEDTSELLFEGIVSVRAVIETVMNGTSDRRIREILVDSGRKTKYPKEFAWLRARAAEMGFQLRETSREEIDARAEGNSHGGLLLISSERSQMKLVPDAIVDRGFYLLLDGIEDPFNFGFAVRSAYAAGADGLIVPERNWLTSAGTVCRSSAGASERAAIFACDPVEAVRIFREQGYRIVCADTEHATPVYESSLTKPLLLVIGGEKRGIPRAVLDGADAVVCLEYGRDFPQALSAASASAVLAFEVLRQNRT